MKEKVMNGLEKFSKAMLSPLSYISAAGLILVLGALLTSTSLSAMIPVLQWTPIKLLGQLIYNCIMVIINNLSLMFCVGIAAALAKKNKQQAAIIGLMSYFMYLTAGNVTLTQLGMLAEADPMVGLRVDDIQKFYGNKGNLTKAIDHISFSVRKGEFLGIMGASGSGKTTLLNCISTIDTVTSGHIYVEEKDITALHGAQLADFRGKKLGFIFQNFNLLDTLTAYENISLALSIAGTKPSEIEQRIPQIAQALNIQDVLGKYPYQMSGGQQQRVAAARAMVTNPAIVLADEPTGALDSNSSRMLLTMLTELNERLSATILMVTHDAFSASYCDRILFIKDGQVFNELHRGTDTRKEFFTKILEVVSVLGGEQSEHM